MATGPMCGSLALEEPEGYGELRQEVMSYPNPGWVLESSYSPEIALTVQGPRIPPRGRAAGLSCVLLGPFPQTPQAPVTSPVLL